MAPHVSGKCARGCGSGPMDTYDGTDQAEPLPALVPCDDKPLRAAFCMASSSPPAPFTETGYGASPYSSMQPALSRRDISVAQRGEQHTPT